MEWIGTITSTLSLYQVGLDIWRNNRVMEELLNLKFVKIVWKCLIVKRIWIHLLELFYEGRHLRRPLEMLIFDRFADYSGHTFLYDCLQSRSKRTFLDLFAAIFGKKESHRTIFLVSSMLVQYFSDTDQKFPWLIALVE